MSRVARQKLKCILQRLARRYGRPRWKSQGKAVDELVATILSQNTNSANSTAAFDLLKKRFPRWSRLADAPVGQIASCIRVSGLSRIKAPRIRKILRQIRDEQGRIDLEFLSAQPARRAMDYLMQFNGVGPKTASCVLMFSFGMAVFPVDTHIHRIAARVGLVGARVSAEQTQELLQPLIPPRDRYAMHLLLIRHGRTICRAGRPLCDKCVLLGLCAHGRRRFDKT